MASLKNKVLNTDDPTLVTESELEKLFEPYEDEEEPSFKEEGVKQVEDSFYRRCYCCRKAFLAKNLKQIYCSKQCSLTYILTLVGYPTKRRYVVYSR